jgi:hypothetical protein
MSELHIKPHLMIVDVAAGHAASCANEEAGNTRPTVIISGDAPSGARLREGLRRLRATPCDLRRRSTSRSPSYLTARSHPDRRAAIGALDISLTDEQSRRLDAVNATASKSSS